MARWQRLVLGTATAPLRTGPALAKGGREHYGLGEHTWQEFDRCLADSRETGVPLAARAARAYLDVAFFHPFADGNARAALLALVFVLGRENVALDEVRPLRIRRFADDPAGAADLAVLVDVLARAAVRRTQAVTPCRDPYP